MGKRENETECREKGKGRAPDLKSEPRCQRRGPGRARRGRAGRDQAPGQVLAQGKGFAFGPAGARRVTRVEEESDAQSEGQTIVQQQFCGS